MNTLSKSLRRKAAAEFLTDNSPIPCSERKLAKLASEGGGPLYRYSGRFPLYDPVDLLAWGHAKIGPQVSSAKEAREIKAAELQREDSAAAVIQNGPGRPAVDTHDPAANAT
jgi:hypothetical protein